ncbi:MAG: sugar transferase [Acidimicrobiales bacterium]
MSTIARGRGADRAQVEAPAGRITTLAPRRSDGGDAFGGLDAPAPASTRRRGAQPQLTKLALLGADLAMIALAVALSARLGASLEVLRSGEQAQHLRAGVLALPVFAAALTKWRLYQARFLSQRAQEFRRMVQAVAVGAVGVVLINALVEGASLRRGWLALFAVSALTLLLAEREVVRRLFGRVRRAGRAQRRTVIVGVGREAQELRKVMDDDRSLGFEFVGYLTVDEPGARLDPGVAGHVLGSVAEAVELVRTHDVGHVLVAGSAGELGALARLARLLLREGVHVELSPGLPDVTAARLTVRMFGRFPVVYLEAATQSGWRALAKRAFDFTAAALGLFVLSPLLVAVAAIIKLDSKGPVFYRQERVGQGGRPFRVAKFRSMVQDAHAHRDELLEQNEADGPLFKLRNDPRVTRVGRVIRKTSIDELPQLFNVLFGEMSLVGPRPALPEEAERWSPELRDRLRVKPGITGMWQVSGRSATSFDEYSRLDLFYVDNWSLGWDLSILARTVPAVLFGRGAA